MATGYSNKKYKWMKMMCGMMFKRMALKFRIRWSVL